MKKIFTLLAVALCAIGASAQGSYYVNVGDKFTSEQEITSVPNIKLTLGADANGYNDGKAYSVFDYTAYVAGKTAPKYTDGVPTTGTFYKFEPQEDGILEFTFIIDKNKKLFVVEDAVKLENLNLKNKSNEILKYVCGEAFSTSVKQYGVGTVDVKAGKTYYIYGEATKMGFFGFKYELAKKSISSSSYATYTSLVPCKTPTGLTAYTAAYNSSTGKVDLKEVADGIIPAKTGVILKGAAKDYTMAAAETTATELAGNELVGLTEAHEVAADDNAYILVNDEGEVKFGKATVGSTIAAGKVYLPIANANAAKLVSMDFGGTNGINAVETVEANDGAYYTLSGVKTLKPAKGQLYIHNGKKFLVK